MRIGKSSSELYETIEMSIQAATPYLISPRLRNTSISEACQEWSQNKDRPSQSLALFGKFLRREIVHIDLICLKGIGTLAQFLNLHP